MRNILARTGECTSGDDKGTVIWTPGTHGIVAMGGHHSTIEVVSVVFDPAVSVGEISVSSAVCKSRTIALLVHVSASAKSYHATHPAPFWIM